MKQFMTYSVSLLGVNVRIATLYSKISKVGENMCKLDNFETKHIHICKKQSHITTVYEHLSIIRDHC